MVCLALFAETFTVADWQVKALEYLWRGCGPASNSATSFVRIADAGFAKLQPRNAEVKRFGGYSIPLLGVPADPAHPAKNTDNGSRN
jgi:hypothetical protein